MPSYIVIICWLLFLHLIYSRSSKHAYFILLVISLSLLVGFRGNEVDNDYIRYFEQYYTLDYTLVDWLLEPISKFIFFTFKYIDVEFYYSMLFFFFITLSLKIYSVEKMKANFSIFLIFYFGYFFIQQEFTQVRLALSISLLFVSLYFLVINKKISYFFYFLAILSHVSALLFGVVFVFRRGGIRVKAWVGVMLALFIFSGFDVLPVKRLLELIISNIGVFGKYAVYLNDYHVDQTMNIYSPSNLIFMFFVILLAYFRERNVVINNTEYYDLSFKLAVIGICLIPLFKEIPLFSYRLSQVLIPFLAITIAILYNNLEKGYEKFFMMFLVFTSSCMFIYILIVRSGVMNDYKSVFYPIY